MLRQCGSREKEKYSREQSDYINKKYNRNATGGALLVTRKVFMCDQLQYILCKDGGRGASPRSRPVSVEVERDAQVGAF